MTTCCVSRTSPWTNHCIHNANCENRAPCVFASQVCHQLIIPEALSIRFSICYKYDYILCNKCWIELNMQVLSNRWSCVIKSWLSNTYNTEIYLSCIKESKYQNRTEYRIALARFRTSSHNLSIEKRQTHKFNEWPTTV